MQRSPRRVTSADLAVMVKALQNRTEMVRGPLLRAQVDEFISTVGPLVNADYVLRSAFAVAASFCVLNQPEAALNHLIVSLCDYGTALP
ncbi:hypothetical protein PQR53_36625 [Paraburkholderia fungorum]|uniref:hypothetical protein n=1 Tax=Paraburkholderia fungorum TaxID=134537 RepID=UPI0038B82AEC